MSDDRWPEDDPYADDSTDATDDTASWAPVDLTGFLDGTHSPAVPTLLTRTDGVALVYPGLTHSFHGESESGKSMLLQIEAVRLIMNGQRVLFVDFESDPGAITERLLMFGATLEAVRDRFVYIRPEANPRSTTAELRAWTAMLDQAYTLAVIDGVTDSLGVFGYATNSNDDITDWARTVPRRIADRTGAAVCVIDHVTKDGDTRGRFAIGGQAKMNGLTGAAYTVAVAEPLGRSLRGVIVVRVAKDRPGYVRGNAGPMRMSDRTQEAARIVVDSTCTTPVVTIEPPHTNGAEAGPGGFRPTALMEKVSRLLETANEPLSRRDIERDVTGKKDTVALALDQLVNTGYAIRANGPRNANLHTTARPYRQAEDPASDTYQHRGTVSAPATVPTVPVPIDRGTGDGGFTVPGDSRGTVGDAAQQPLSVVDGVAIYQEHP